jgi:hypothetical protein
MPVIKMPVLLIFGKGEALDCVVGFKEAIAGIVAQELSCDDPNGELDIDDIELRYLGENKLTDVSKNDVDIIIFANDFPSRKVNLEQRRIAIIKQLKKIFPRGIKGSVYIRLAPAAYGEFQT